MDKNSHHVLIYMCKFFLIFLLVYFSLLLPNEMLWDRDNYLIYAENSENIIASYNSVKDLIFNDYLFLKINSFLAMFFPAHYVVYMLVFFNIFSFYYLLSRCSLNIISFVFGIIISILLVPVLHLEIIAIRQALATTLIMFAMIFFKDKIKITVIFLIASLIHSAFFLFSFIFILDNFAFNKFDKKKRVLLNGIVILIISFSYLVVAELLGLRQVDLYTSYDAPIGGGTFLICLFIFAYLYLYGRVNNNYIYYFSMQGLLLFLLFYFVANASISARLLETVLPFFLFLFVQKFRINEIIIGGLIFIAYSYVWYNGGVYVLFEVSDIQVKQFFINLL